MHSLIENIKKCDVVFSKEQKKWTLIVLFFSIIGAVLETVGVSIVLPFADVLLQPEEAYLNSNYQLLIQWFGIPTAEQLIIFLAVTIALVYIIKNLYFMFLSWIKRTRLSSKTLKLDQRYAILTWWKAV